MDRRLFGLSALASFAAMSIPAAASQQRPDRVQVIKSQRRMDLIASGKIIKSYDVQLGSNPVGHKRFQGDGRTPEGGYLISRRNPRSNFYLSLHIDYPRMPDIAYARRYRKSPGGDIFVHGQPNAARRALRGDWTAGCVALSNEDMREVWNLVPVGIPIHIFA